MKTANEKASEILGHQEGCASQKPTGYDIDYQCWTKGECTCSHAPEIQVAAIRETLRKEHAWRGYGFSSECARCHQIRARLPHEDFSGPCFPPIDDGEKWRMLRAMIGTWHGPGRLPVDPSRLQRALYAHPDGIVQEYIAAHDAGLLEKKDD